VSAYRELAQYAVTSVHGLLDVMTRVTTLIEDLDEAASNDLFGAGQTYAGISVTVLQSLIDGSLRVEIAPDP
jgi:hypothetical protein